MFKEKGKDTGIILIIIKPVFIACYLPDVVLSVGDNGRGRGRMDKDTPSWSSRSLMRDRLTKSYQVSTVR